MVEAEAIGLQREFPQVGPEAVLGLEVNPYAAELARVSVWIGHIQWARRHGFPTPAAMRVGAMSGNPIVAYGAWEVALQVSSTGLASFRGSRR